MPDDKWAKYASTDSGGDKWAKYATAVETPDPTKPEPSVGASQTIRKPLTDAAESSKRRFLDLPFSSEGSMRPAFGAAPGEVHRRAQDTMGTLGMISGGAAFGPETTTGLPWILRALASSSGAGFGGGAAELLGGTRPKEALESAAKTTATIFPMEVGAVGAGKALEKAKGSKLVKQVLKSKVTELEEKHAAKAAEIEANYKKELAAHQEEVSKVEKVNAQKALEHQEKLQRIEQRYQKRLSEHQAKVQEADLDYKKRVEEHKQRVADIKKDYARKLSEHQKESKDVSIRQSQTEAKKGLAVEHQNDLAGALKENLELTHEKISKDLGAEFDKVNDAVQAKNPKVKVSDAQREARGHLYNPDSVASFNNIMENVSGKLGSTDFSILRKAYSNLNDVLYGSKEIPADLYQAVKVIRDSLGNDLKVAAGKVGLGGKYSKVMSDYADFKDVWDDASAIAKGGSPIRRILDAQDPAFVIDQLKGKAGDRLVEDIGKYSKYGADKPLAGSLKGLIERVEGFPSSAPDIPKAPSRPSFPKVPERGAELKAPESPYKPKAPTPRETPKPPEQQQLAPFDREAVARAILADRIKKALMYGGAAAGGGYLYEKFGGKGATPVP